MVPRRAIVGMGRRKVRVLGGREWQALASVNAQEVDSSKEQVEAG